MKQLEIFDPALCCSTGVCGPSIDPELLRMAAVIQSLNENGADIKRYNLAQEPQAFITNAAVNRVLQQDGVESLPLTLLQGNVVKTKSYPSNSEIEAWLDVKIKTKEVNDSCCGPQAEEACCAESQDEESCCGSQACC